jgi:hypothetical protein
VVRTVTVTVTEQNQPTMRAIRHCANFVLAWCLHRKLIDVDLTIASVK